MSKYKFDRRVQRPVSYATPASAGVIEHKGKVCRRSGAQNNRARAAVVVWLATGYQTHGWIDGNTLHYICR